MSNSSPGGKKAKHGATLTARWRGAVLNTFDCVEKEGKLISEILAEEFKKNPIKFMELASKGMVQEVSKDVNHNLTIETLTDAELDERIEGYDRIIQSMQAGLDGVKISQGKETKH